ncbi:hypothetical protein ACFJZ3_002545 [Vibrio vulnificus]|nr:hypothetical protein [Vibrio vulnificus]
MIKKFLKTHIFKEAYVRRCSQTVYQSLMAAVSVHRIEKKTSTLALVEEIALVLVSIQRPDGGFDIGYDFNFGKLHRKGESTSPELYAVVALNAAYDVLLEDRENYKESIILIESSIKMSVEWIKQHYIQIDDRNCAIPYGPYSTKNIMVYNGVSFAVGALGTSLRFYKGQELEELSRIYDGFISYLLDSLYETEFGYVWYYNVQNRTDIDNVALKKIDFYHQAQQLEMHSIANMSAPRLNQLKIIKKAASTLIDIANKKNGAVPYTNDDIYFGGRYYLWGFSSLIPGLLKSVIHVPEFKDNIETAVSKVNDFISKHAVANSHYLSVLSKDLSKIDYPYMPRSDAWVVASRLYYSEYYNKDNIHFDKEILRRIVDCDYSGQENHAQNKRKKILIRIISIMNEIKR